MKTTWLRAVLRKGGIVGALIVASFLLLLALWRRKWAVLAALVVVLAILLLTQLPSPYPGHPGELRVTFLEVGKGDAAVIESPSGRVLVVDTGGLLPGGQDKGGRIVAPFLRSRGVRHIDTLLLTHPHPDHVGGAATLLRQFPVGRLVDNGVASSSPLVRRYRAAAEARGVPYERARRGQEMDLGCGVRVRVLGPPAPPAPGGINNTSVVLRVGYGRTAFLLTGDAEAEAEAELVRRRQPLACDVLKVGHHGSSRSTTPRFLAAAHPRVAVISVNAGNRHGYPSPAVLDRLRRSGARIYRTDKDGAVTCLSNGLRIRVRTGATPPQF